MNSTRLGLRSQQHSVEHDLKAPLMVMVRESLPRTATPHLFNSGGSPVSTFTSGQRVVQLAFHSRLSLLFENLESKVLLYYH
jgi:hypothetical protein